MPSPAKFEALRQAGFKIQDCCLSCEHWQNEGQWGRCTLIRYQHEKHVGVKLAGTPPDGWCEEYSRSNLSAVWYPEFRASPPPPSE